MWWNWVWELTKAFFKFNLWKDPSRKIQLCSKPHILGGVGERWWGPKTDLGTSTWVVPSGYFEGQQRRVLRSIWWSCTSKPPPSVSLSLVTYWIVFLALPVQFQVFIKENRQNGRGRLPSNQKKKMSKRNFTRVSTKTYLMAWLLPLFKPDVSVNCLPGWLPLALFVGYPGPSSPTVHVGPNTFGGLRPLCIYRL